MAAAIARARPVWCDMLIPATHILVFPSGTEGRESGAGIAKNFEKQPIIDISSVIVVA